MVKIALFFILLPFIMLEARALEFKPQQKAHYKLDYRIEGNPRLDEPDVKSRIELDISILDGTAYPFTVQIALTDVECNGSDTQEKGLRLEYVVYNPQQIEELGGELLTPATEFCLHAFLGQLFQLSGGTLMNKRTYQLFSYFLLHDFDQLVSAETHAVFERSSLHVKKKTNHVIEGEWQGHSYVREGKQFEGRVDVKGSLHWNLGNPLIQQRKNILQLIELNRNYTDGMQTTTSIKITQKWESS